MSDLFDLSDRMLQARVQVHLPEGWGTCNAILLDYLLERMQLHRQWCDPPRRKANPPFPGRWHYDFFTRRALLLISCEGDPTGEPQRAWWHLYANSEDDLFELAYLIWPGAGLPLQSVAVEGDTVLGRLLERLRDHFRGTGHDGI